MNWKKISSAVGKVAPLLGGALGGPAGAGIGQLISTTLGVEATPAAVSEALVSNPEAAVELRQLELNHKLELERLALGTLSEELNDKQSARVVHSHSKIPAVIVCMLTVMVGLGGYLLFAAEISQQNAEITYLMYGTVLAKWGDSIAYWVGTTRSSAEKSFGKQK